MVEDFLRKNYFFNENKLTKNIFPKKKNSVIPNSRSAVT